MIARVSTAALAFCLAWWFGASDLRAQEAPPPETPRAAPAVVVSTEATVVGDSIRLSDVARLENFADSRRAALAELDLGASAEPGRVRVLSGPGLRSRIARAAPEAQLRVPELTRVRSAARRIEPTWVREQLERGLRHAMPWPQESVRVSDWRLPTAFDAAPDAEKMLIRFAPGEDFLGRVTLAFALPDPASQTGREVRRSATVEVAATLPLLVTTRALRRGETITDDAVALEARELRSVPSGFIDDPSHALGQKASQRLPAGALLLFRHLAHEPVVRRGERVEVRVEQGGLELLIAARALESGAPGQVIEVENPSTRRRFRAEITAPGHARMLLPGVGASR